MKDRAVPTGLLPLAERDVNEAWAVRTYQYRHVFNYSSESDDVSSKDIVEWIKEAKLLCNELREYGTTKAEEQIVRICQHYYHRELKQYFNKVRYTNWISPHDQWVLPSLS